MLTNGYPYARTNIHAHRWGRLAHTNPDVLALSEPHNKQAVSLTYKECETTILQAAAGLAALGLKRSESVSVCAEQGCVCELGSASLPVNLLHSAMSKSDYPYGLPCLVQSNALLKALTCFFSW